MLRCLGTLRSLGNSTMKMCSGLCQWPTSRALLLTRQGRLLKAPTGAGPSRPPRRAAAAARETPRPATRSGESPASVTTLHINPSLVSLASVTTRSSRTATMRPRQCDPVNHAAHLPYFVPPQPPPSCRASRCLRPCCVRAAFGDPRHEASHAASRPSPRPAGPGPRRRAPRYPSRWGATRIL